ncbi:DUF4386 domain-containing protein [Paenibacillus planticolens]|uniref:DUF4386 family protein n=1 Tax=Paenibacillus planticolens TaxID=2654976 RepID=A0ABX1ZGQ3_9BACL|nr:DUF4386 domain-containing protein [Paenibacillus planticolens]NOU98857.1 DUF4386 family protein [Paenibacillus planticolens]
MNANLKSARMAGVLFLVATVTYMLGKGLMDSILNEPNYLLHVYPNRTQMITGVLLELVNSVAVVGIAVFLFPILKKYNEKIALGYVAFRVIEAVILIIGAISPLLLIQFSQAYIDTGAPADSYYQAVGMLVIKGNYYAFQLAMIVLGLYSLLFCYFLLQSKLIPRLLSVLGLIGYASLLTSGLLELFGYSSGMILFLPGALFELLFPIWLIIKGFNTSTMEPKQ